MTKKKEVKEKIKGSSFEKDMIQCPVCSGNDESCETCKGLGQIKK